VFSYLALFASLLFGAAPSWFDPVPLTIPEIRSGKFDYRPASLTGTVQDVLDDTSDADHIFIIVSQGNESILVPVAHAKYIFEELRQMIGAVAVFTGNVDSFVQTTSRRLMGRRFNVASPDDIRILQTPGDPFQAPDILALENASPEEIVRAPRHRAVGRVLAVWGGDNVLLATDTNRLVRLELATLPAPRCGDSIEAIGFPETDLCLANLARAVWRPAPDGQTSPYPSEVTASDIRSLLERDGVPVFPLDSLGKTIRLQGVVKGVPRNGILLLEDNGYLLSVDISALNQQPAIREGSLLEVTGTCIVMSDNWRPNAQFPKIRGAMLVVRTQSDIRLLADPPWWTIARLFAVIGALGAALLGILIWNRALQVVAERRGKLLYREQIQSVRAEMKYRERTNLAVELHDAISQYLTGIALELRTVEGFTGNLAEGARRHLHVASRTLASCRDELRNCLWDLRHDTLEQNNIAEAIRRTLEPHVGSARLSVRFNISRKRFTENSVHTVLQIVRELATNAVRHGNATEIRIAGALEGDQLLLSVRDNGRGFDPERCPGMEEGHFGLLGVRERIEKFDGTLEITSKPGKGSKFVARLSLKSEEP